MKVVILAGGLGTRLMEETEARPKPMVEIGGKPILWHIMKLYEFYGHREFIICLGYKASYIKEYFMNYYIHNSDITIELDNNKVEVHFSKSESFKVTLIDTGLKTNTAGRIYKIKEHVSDETFLMTYGDGVCNVDVNKLIDFHYEHGRLATLTAIQMPGKFGNIEMDNQGIIDMFQEKPSDDGTWINGGFFVLDPKIFNYLNNEMDTIQWEKGPLIELAKNAQLVAYKHTGFWKCMDAIRDRIELEELWNTGKAEWKIWTL
jgi:glucose-1-phosphate cytidylyltransferase